MMKIEIDRSRAAAAAAGAALTAAGMAVIALADGQSSESTTVGIEHLALALFSLTLLFLAPPILHLGETLAGKVGTRAAVAAAAGQIALAALSTVSNLLGEDPSFFAAVAVPANLLILGGWVTLAVALGRAHACPTWMAVGIPLSYLALLPAGQVGGGLLTGLFWLAVARQLGAAELRRPGFSAG